MNSDPVKSLFVTEPLTDDQVSSYNEIVYSPESAPRSNNGTDPLFTIVCRNNAAEEFLLPARAYLQVGYKLVASDSDITTAVVAAAGIVNGWSLFKQARVEINGSEIETCDSPMHVSNMLGLIGRSESNVLKNGDVSSWYPPLKDSEGYTDADDGDERRQKALRRDGSYSPTFHQTIHWLKLPLHEILGFCKLDKAYRGAQFRFHFTPETDMSKILVLATGSLVRYCRITSINLVMPAVRPSLELLADINNDLMKGKEIPIEFDRIHYRLYKDSAVGAHSLDVPISTAARRPTHVLVGIQRAVGAERNIVGATDVLPVCYDMEDITSHSIQVNGTQFPLREFQGKNGGYIREYNAFLALTGATLSDQSSNFVDFTMYKSLYPILCYDCEALQDVGSGTSFASIQHRLSYTSAAVNNSIHYLVIAPERRILKEESGSLIVQLK